MTNINTNNWKFFTIKELFPKLIKGKCSNAPDLIDGKDVPYIGAKKTENGVMRWCKYDYKLISEPNCICFICQGAGSNGYCNYFDIETIQSTSNVLGYNKNLNKYNALFIVTVADLERPKWCFGRGRAPKLASTRIKLPADQNGNPDWDYMTNYIKELRKNEKENSELAQPLTNNQLIFNAKEWQWFFIKDIFTIPKIKKYSSIPENDGNIPFISSTGINNGVVKYVDTIPSYEGRCISVSTNGKCFDCFLQDGKICVSTDVEILVNDKVNKNILLFIITVLKREQFKWGFGRKCKNNAIANTKIKLPVDQNGKPDWEFMEAYIQSLPYSKYL